MGYLSGIAGVLQCRRGCRSDLVTGIRVMTQTGRDAIDIDVDLTSYDFKYPLIHTLTGAFSFRTAVHLHPRGEMKVEKRRRVGETLHSSIFASSAMVSPSCPISLAILKSCSSPGQQRRDSHTHRDH